MEIQYRVNITSALGLLSVVKLMKAAVQAEKLLFYLLFLDPCSVTDCRHKSGSCLIFPLIKLFFCLFAFLGFLLHFYLLIIHSSTIKKHLR